MSDTLSGTSLAKTRGVLRAMLGGGTHPTGWQFFSPLVILALKEMFGENIARDWARGLDDKELAAIAIRLADFIQPTLDAQRKSLDHLQTLVDAFRSWGTTTSQPPAKKVTRNV